DLDAQGFFEHVARLLPKSGHALGELAELHTDDLYLACACARAIPAALGAFERHFLSEIVATIARVNRAPDFRQEVLQQLRERVVAGAQPKIASYSGKGPLIAWLRVAATRTALNLHRTTRRSEDRDRASELVPQSTAPDTDLLYTRYRQPLEEALHQ